MRFWFPLRCPAPHARRDRDRARAGHGTLEGDFDEMVPQRVRPIVQSEIMRGVLKRALVVFGMVAGWSLTALAQTQADPSEVLAQEIAAPSAASDHSGSESRLGSGTAEQPSPGAEPPTSMERPARWGLSANLGAGIVKDEFSSILTTPISGELSLFRTQGPWRFGAGLSFGSFSMRPPYVHGLEFGFQQTYLYATRMLTDGPVKPYLQVRGGLARLHPRSHLFDEQTLPDDFVLGGSTTKAANGWSVGFVPGLEWTLNRSVALDFSAASTNFNVGDYDLSPAGLPPASRGPTTHGRLGAPCP